MISGMDYNAAQEHLDFLEQQRKIIEDNYHEIATLAGQLDSVYEGSAASEAQDALIGTAKQMNDDVTELVTNFRNAVSSDIESRQSEEAALKQSLDGAVKQTQ